MQFSEELQVLETSIKDSIWRMHSDRLGYPPSSVTCTFLKSLDLIISIERSRSVAEQFLLKQEKLQLAQETGIAINQILKNEISRVLNSDFDLPIAEVVFLKPVGIDKFSLWVVADSQR
ncbi:MAG: Na-translocating system protein MpsC family protein [Phormidesmis sp.]